MAPQFLSPERREFAAIAISCATAILKMVLDEPDVRNALVGVPLYLHTMISYAAVFLIKVHQKWKAFQLGTDSLLIRGLVGQVIDVLNQGRASERHITYHIASGLRKILDRFTEWELHEPQALMKDTQAPGDLPPVAAAGAFPPSNGSYDLNRNYPPPDHGFYGQQPMELYDFPIGFFDVFSSYMPD